MAERFASSFQSNLGAAIPVACGLLGAVIANIPLSLISGAIPSPMLALMPIYFWSLVRPDLMPVAAVFAIGLLQDLLSGGPPGIWTASFIATYAFVSRQRESFAGLAGIAAILGFAFAMLIASLVAFAIMTFYIGRLPPVTPLAVQLAVSAVFYIPVAALLSGIHRRMVGPLRSDF